MVTTTAPLLARTDPSKLGSDPVPAEKPPP